MRKVLVVGYDSMYGGLHGMYEAEVIEVNDDTTEEELWEEYIRPMAENVIDMYGTEKEFIADPPDEDDFATEEDYQTAYDNWESECREALIDAYDGYGAWLKPTDKTLEELNHILWHEIGFELFTKKYCE